MNKDIALIYESDENSEEKEYQDNRKRKYLKYFSKLVSWESYQNSAIHRYEKRKYKYEIYR